jgi:hypothetical protein
MQDLKVLKSCQVIRYVSDKLKTNISDIIQQVEHQFDKLVCVCVCVCIYIYIYIQIPGFIINQR